MKTFCCFWVMKQKRGRIKVISDQKTYSQVKYITDELESQRQTLNSQKQGVYTALKHNRMYCRYLSNRVSFGKERVAFVPTARFL